MKASSATEKLGIDQRLDLLDEANHKNTRVLKHSAVMSALNLLGIVSALILDMIIAAKYGLQANADAFFTAMTIPLLVSQMLTTSANLALVPVFTNALLERGPVATWKLASIIANLGTVVLSITAFVGMLLSPFIIVVIAPGLDLQTRVLAVRLSRVLFLTLVPISFIEVIKAVINARDRFATPASVTPVGNMLAVACILALDRSLGIRAAAWAFALKPLAEFLILLGDLLLRERFTYHFSLDLGYSGVRRGVYLVTARMGGLMLRSTNTILERFFASFLPAGTISALNYARRLSLAMSGVVTTSVSTALLPRISVFTCQEAWPELRRAIAFGVKLISFVVLPLAAGVMALNLPLVQLLMQRGAFDAWATQFTASLISLFMLGIPFQALMRLLLAPFYASQHVRTLTLLQVAMLTLNIALDIVLILLMEAAGIPLAFALTSVVNVIIAVWLLRRHIGSFNGDLVRFLGKVGVATLVMSITIFLVWQSVAPWISSTMELLLAVPALVGVGIALYLGSVMLLRVQEFSQMVAIVRGRLMT
ncbi:MAG: polysaccharide biosynthesis C-terminal domain-containing protein [Chloroflexi bacterium]|nr:polysaccharide biosynthesis C-terminal domain-containing protein [Chloroflexota bacterium]